MLSFKNRLKKKKDFETVFKKGRGVKKDFLFLKWGFNGLKISRFGFIVGKKVSKKSVTRNKIKRKLRELFKLKINKIKPGLDVALVVGSGARVKDFPKFEGILDDIFQKAGILK